MVKKYNCEKVGGNPDGLVICGAIPIIYKGDHPIPHRHIEFDEDLSDEEKEKIIKEYSQALQKVMITNNLCKRKKVGRIIKDG